MDAHDVSTIVNSAKYDGSECLEPISDDQYPALNYRWCNSATGMKIDGSNTRK